MKAKLDELGIAPSEKYGVFKTKDINNTFQPLNDFRTKWSGELGRDVNFVGYPKPVARDATEYILRAQSGTNSRLSVSSGGRYYNGGTPAIEGTPYSPSVINARSAENYSFYGDGNLMRGAWNNPDVRAWYKAEDELLPSYIDRSLPLELQAKQGFDMRNINRDRARELMYDRAGADRLYREEPNREWKSFIRYKESKGLQGDDIYRSILQTMTKTRAEVNKLYDLD